MDLDAHWCPHAALQHDDARSNRHERRRTGDSRALRGGDHFVPDVGRRPNVVSPLPNSRSVLCNAVLGMIRDDGLEHRQRRRVECRLGAAEFAHRPVDLGNLGDRGIDLREHLQHFPHRCVRHRRRHVEKGALVEWRHVFAAKSRKCVGGLRDDRCRS